MQKRVVKVVDATATLRQMDSDRRELDAIHRGNPKKRKAPSVDPFMEPVKAAAAAAPRAKPEVSTVSLKAASKSVANYGATALIKQDKKAYERKQFADLGAKVSGPPKCPLKMLQGMRKKNEFRAERKRQREIASGLTPAKIKKDKPRHDNRGVGGTVGGLGVGVGKFSGGVLKLGRGDIENINKSGPSNASLSSMLNPNKKPRPDFARSKKPSGKKSSKGKGRR